MGGTSVTHRKLLLATGAFGAICLNTPPAFAAAPAVAGADAAAASPSSVDEVVVTGVRGRPRTVIDSPVPIDIISAAQITETGKVGLKQILSSVIPSLTLPAEMSGVSAAAPPYAVEGLTGDYVLVLVNGKRRHGTALINNLATIGGGSTPVDLDLIPPSAIDHVEYLRDGAAAQYGSDAVAGVINIILKDASSGGFADTTAGQTYQNSGRLLQENANWGTKFFGGSINFALAAVHDEPSPASEAAAGVFYPLVHGAPDPRESTFNPNYFKAYGRSQTTNQINTSYNLSTPVGGNFEVYSFSTFSYRDITDTRGDSRPDDLPSLPAIYPNGFNPQRLLRETDFQLALGAKGQWAGWNLDFSSTYGRDYVWLGAQDSLNASLGPTVTQTSFYVGKQIFDQLTNNIDVSRSFGIGLSKPLDVSFGVEQRWEQYAIIAGEPNSYLDGEYVVPNDGTPFGNLYHGKAENAGVNSVSSFAPADASTHSRNNYAAYVDLGTNITKPWYLGLAGRFEHFDDSSGDSLNGKVTTRYEILPGLALRGSVGNAFHAPSLAEQWFSSTQNSTLVAANGQTLQAQVKFLPVGNPAAIALGAKPLVPETSVNYSVGMTYQPLHRLQLTLDAYEIDITNLITKSSPVVNPAAQAILNTLGYPNLASAQFFTNGVDTTTRGLDGVVEYSQLLPDAGEIRWSAIYSVNATDITHILAGAVNYNAMSQRQLVEQTPRYRLALGADWSWRRWKVNVLETLYGPYEEPVNSTVDMDFHARWITNLDISYRLRDNLTISAGATNLFNTFPDRQPAAVLALMATDTNITRAPGYSAAGYGIPSYGAFQYGVASPYGLQGGFYYMRFKVKF
jgi:iron complex outermembrane receptor protein